MDQNILSFYRLANHASDTRGEFAVGDYQLGGLGPLGEFSISLHLIGGSLEPKIECFDDGLGALALAIALGLHTILGEVPDADAFQRCLCDLGLKNERAL